ncbi:hypothetical protein GCM10011492_03250 [Flexivirga endophytica]|uniref:Concanavalin A-like lectin/glucanase n=1 Tax=Flexivirga endophytica TaxID=1849103 RepID=A0A916SWF2_9MICO|nr:G1 family glutamic endopeptidase [Flexivirga endophytica]GGB16811.1 hypothetical protein GCM10011492_03250 [Flexivirga endophytica]GHB38722.1 hypothetical protein GCM10008112_04360 [Flexivirga endophytica]
MSCKARVDHTTPLTLAASSNWSGYIKTTSAPNYADAEWHVPTVSGGGHAAYSAIWPGIGGTTSTGKLIHDGTEQDVSAGGTQTDYFWFEIVPGESEQEVTNLVPKIGDDVATDVFWSTTTGAEFGLCDYTKATCVTGSQSSTAPGNSAEWIVERPTIGTSLPRLADFKSVKMFNGGYDESPQGSREYNISGSPETMVGSSGDDLSVPGTISGDAFTTTWKAYS